MRAEAPVHRDPRTGAYFVSRYADVRAALRDTDTFSSRVGALTATADDPLRGILEQTVPFVETISGSDAPEHAQFRALASDAFADRRVAGLAPRLEALCHALVDELAPRGGCELRGDYAAPLAVAAIAELVGVASSDAPLLRRWSEGFSAQLAGRAAGEEAIDAMRRVLEFQHYFAARLDESRHTPRGDLLSALGRARLPGGRALELGESLSLVQQLLVAGCEPTASAITEGVWQGIEHPDCWALVRSERALLPGFVEETLRLASPAPNVWRRTTRDSELGGVAIPAGSRVLLQLGLANRDATMFPGPDRLDPRRANVGAHLAFGGGAHRCLGAGLARALIAPAIGVLLDRLDDLRLAPGAAPPSYRVSPLLRGFAELPIAFGARRA